MTVTNCGILGLTVASTRVVKQGDPSPLPFELLMLEP